MWDGLSRRSLGHQQHAQVVVGVLIGWVKTENGTEFLFRQFGLLFSGEEVAQVVVRLGGLWVELQGLVECRERIGVFPQAAFNDPQQVQALHAGRALLQFLQEGGLGFFKMALLKESFRLLEVRRGLGCMLLARARLSSKEKRQQREQSAG